MLDESCLFLICSHKSVTISEGDTWNDQQSTQSKTSSYWSISQAGSIQSTTQAWHLRYPCSHDFVTETWRASVRLTRATKHRRQRKSCDCVMHPKRLRMRRPFQPKTTLKRVSTLAAIDNSVQLALLGPRKSCFVPESVEVVWRWVTAAAERRLMSSSPPPDMVYCGSPSL